MSREAEKVLEDGLRLPPQARAAVASQLIESLDEGVDENAKADWSAEIAQRLKELDSGSVRAIPWEQARRRIHERLDARPRR